MEQALLPLRAVELVVDEEEGTTRMRAYGNRMTSALR